MADFEELSFVIPAFTPETMPLDRLIEYLQQAAVIIGDPEKLHLVKIEKSSTAPVLRVDKVTAVRAREQLARVERGEGTQRQSEAYNRLRRMIRRDARDARDAGKPATLRTAQTVLLEIPAAPDESGVVSGVRQFTTIDGALTKIGGTGDYPSLQMQDLSGKVLSGFTATKSLVKEMAILLYEPIRVSGIGVWGRDEDGVWALEKMQVQSYETLEEEDAEAVLAKLRSHKVAWPIDAIDRLRDLREPTQ